MSVGVALMDWDSSVEQIADDVRAIGFDRVYLTVEDRHVTWRPENVIEAVATLNDYELEVWLDPWRVGGLFAGQTYARAQQRLLEPFGSFLDLAERTQAAGVLLDEPDPRLTALIFGAADRRALEFEYNAQPERFDVIESKPRRSVSTYHHGPNDWAAWEERTQRWNADLPADVMPWVQLWNVPNGYEHAPADMLAAYLLRGRDVNVWGYEACRTVSSLRSPRWRDVWEAVCERVGEASA